MSEPLLVAKNDKTEVFLLPQMANRHGLITEATDTGKTITLQVLAEHFSSIGVPCFMSDIKATCPAFRKPEAATRASTSVWPCSSWPISGPLPTR